MSKPKRRPGAKESSKDTASRAARARQTLESTRLRETAERSTLAHKRDRTRLASRSQLGVRRAGKETVSTQARGRRREPKKGAP